MIEVTSSRVARMPMIFHAAAVTRRLLRAPGTRLIYRSPLMTPLRSLFVSKAPPGPRIITICGGRLAGARMSIDLRDEKYYWLGTHEPHVQEAIARAVPRGAIAWDIGAHAGFFSLLLSRTAGPLGRVMAFEPQPQNIERLRASAEASGATNIESYCIAISDETGDAEFSLHESSLEGSLAERAGDARAEDPRSGTEQGDGTITVRTSTIDDLVRAGMAAPHAIKVDVEGAEARVIAGARHTIELCQPLLLLEVHSQEAARDVAAALPVSYEFEELISRRRVSALTEPGHYLGRARTAGDDCDPSSSATQGEKQ